jgi:hypothetical protein
VVVFSSGGAPSAANITTESAALVAVATDLDLLSPMTRLSEPAAGRQSELCRGKTED